MKPFKSALPFATWLVRIVFAAFIIASNIKGVNPMNLESLNFYLSLLMLVFAALLIIGGFLSKQTITILSAIIVGLILIYRLVYPTPDLLSISTFKELLLISLSFFFVCRGN